MDAKQAIAVLEKATQNLNGTRSDHLMIIAALDVLKEAIGTKPPPAPAPTPAEAPK